MLFNSYIFILLFLPACMLGYFGLNRFGRYQTAQVFLLVMSLWFYGYFNPSYLAIILVSICVNFFFTRCFHRLRNCLTRKLLFVTALLFNLGILFYFKYYNFFLENINALFGLSLATKNILLPLGISFFTFQQVSYVIDAYRGQVEEYPFLQYASFVVYFPQLIAGPIVTHDELIPQFLDPEKKRFSWDNFEPGMYLFVLGLAKKVLIADVFGSAANWGFANAQTLSCADAILTSLAYTIQIYFDFSGYCDMAIGLGRMMNLTLPLNFNSPYRSLSITEFWDRWHMTLTRFFTRYIYIPLGGSRRGMARTCLNVLTVFLASGFWHGANWTFILWGCLHGIFSVLTRLFSGLWKKLPKALAWLLTFIFVDLTWVLFRADSISHAAALLGRMFSGAPGGVSGELTKAFLLPELEMILGPIRIFGILEQNPALCALLFFGAAMLLILNPRNAHTRMETDRPGVLRTLWTVFLLLWCIFSFSGVSTFLYFNF